MIRPLFLVLMVLLLSGCAHYTRYTCEPGYIPVRHRDSNRKACLLIPYYRQHARDWILL